MQRADSNSELVSITLTENQARILLSLLEYFEEIDEIGSVGGGR